MSAIKSALNGYNGITVKSWINVNLLLSQKNVATVCVSVTVELAAD